MDSYAVGNMVAYAAWAGARAVENIRYSNNLNGWINYARSCEQGVVERDHEITRLHNLLARKDAEIERLRGVVREQSARLTSWENLCEKKDQALIWAEAMRKVFEATCAELERQGQEQQAALSEANASIEALKEDLRQQSVHTLTVTVMFQALEIEMGAIFAPWRPTEDHAFHPVTKEGLAERVRRNRAHFAGTGCLTYTPDVKYPVGWVTEIRKALRQQAEQLFERAAMLNLLVFEIGCAVQPQGTTYTPEKRQAYFDKERARFDALNSVTCVMGRPPAYPASNPLLQPRQAPAGGPAAASVMPGTSQGEA